MSKDPSANGRESTDARWSSSPPASHRSALTSAVIPRASSETSAPKSMAYGYLSESLDRNPPPPHPTSRTAPSMDLGSRSRQNVHRGT